MSQDQDQDPFIPPPPPRFSGGNPLYPPEVLEQKAKEVEDLLRKALIFGVLGVVFCGGLLGILAFHRASKATKIIAQYGVMKEKRTMAIALKVLGIFDLITFAIMVLMKDYS